MLFCDGTRRDALQQKKIIDMYCTTTRIKASIGKSTISFSSVSDEDIKFFFEMSPYQHIEFQSGLKYLGFYIKPTA